MAPARPFVAAFVAAVIGAGAAGAASGQSASPLDRVPAARVQVEGIDVEQVERLAPGVPLNFSVYGSPGAAAMLRIDGARTVVDLRETQPGIYEGTYVIAPHDRVRADSRVVATLQRGPATAQASLEESLQLGHGVGPPLDHERARPGSDESVEPPVAERSRRYEPNVAEPHGRHEPSVAEDNGRRERNVAERSGRFQRDAPDRGGPVARSAAVPAVAAPGFARSACDTCGIVEAIRVVSGAPGPGNLGAVSGTLIGAVLGERAREAHMRRIARIHGSVTGALTGRRADRDGGARHEVRFRMPDGRTQWRSYPEPPAFQVGDRVSLDAPATADTAALPTRP